MLKVLIVEDEDMIRKGLIHTMDWTNMGCTIIGEARNGVEGLAQIKSLSPDVVFTDIIMPKMNGIEMLEAAREGQNFKSIILTSYSEFSYAQKAIQLKASGYLLKPIDEEELFQLVVKVGEEIRTQHHYKTLLDHTKDKQEIQLVDLDFYIQKQEVLNPYVLQAMTEIKTHYNKKITIEGIAASLGVSSSYLSRKFKEETAQTFLEMLHKYRLQKAIELLSIGTYKVYEVSEKSGFSEYKHFCTVFKKYIGRSPTEFIKSEGFMMCKK